MKRSTSILCLALLAGLALTCCLAKEASQQQPSLASKLVPKARTARSLSDMLEKMKSKIFGSKKQAASTSSQVLPAASINSVQRQPWNDLNSFNQQYNPYTSLSNNYQWPVGSNGQFLNQQYSPVGGFSQGSSSYPSISGSQPQSGAQMMSMDGSQSSSQSQLGSAANTNSGSNQGGLLSSASHLFTQYLSPSSSGSSVASVPAQSGSQASVQSQGVGSQSQSGPQSLLSPQQTQQYNDFASILDSMVAQTSPQRPTSNNMNQYMNGAASVGSQNQQPMSQQQGVQGYQSMPNSMISSNGQVVGDNDMSGSSNVQSYMPAATPQQASQKSSMVSLAEQLAPGAQFNKLVSFPFSLSNNDDSSKEGRYKLHIPFLNQHVKRSDQQQQVNSVMNQQRQQQYLNAYYNQQQQYLAQQQQQNQQAQQQLMAQSSQVVPTVVSPHLSVASQPVSGSSIQSSQSSAPVQPVASVAPSSVSSSSSVSQSSSPIASPNQSSAAQTNSRPAWSVADTSSKLIPIQSSPSADSNSQN